MSNEYFLNYEKGTPSGWESTGCIISKDYTVVDFDSLKNYPIKLDKGEIY